MTIIRSRAVVAAHPHPDHPAHQRQHLVFGTSDAHLAVAGDITPHRARIVASSRHTVTWMTSESIAPPIGSTVTIVRTDAVTNASISRRGRMHPLTRR